MIESHHHWLDTSIAASQHGENLLQMSRVEDDQPFSKERADFCQLKSPPQEVNKTAQQHFNNKSVERQNISGSNLSSNRNNSASNISFKERSLLSPGIQRQFSQIDQFLKQTYQKHGIYDLIRSFVDMEDQLVNAFEYSKKLQRIKNNQYEKTQNKIMISSFEEIKQDDEFSFQAEENIIHQFLYSLQQFFISQNIPNQKCTENIQSAADYSFSAQKPQPQENSQNSIAGKKNVCIHTSRPKNAIWTGLRSKRNVFSDEKMIQSININKTLTPLKFDESFIFNINNINKLPSVYQKTQSFRKTNSEIIGEQSTESENNYQLSSQQELLKTIFQLRQEVLMLKQQKGGHTGFSSGESSFHLDGSLLGEHNFKSVRENQGQQKDDSLLLDSSRQFGSLVNNNFQIYKSQQQQQRTPMLINSYTKPLIINQDVVNEQNSQSNSASTFKLDMLQSVEQQQDKQNDPNFNNVLQKYFSNSKSKPVHAKSSQQLLTEKFNLINNTQSNFIQQSSHQNNLLFKANKQRTSRSQTLSNIKSETNIFIEKFFEDFKKFFRTQMQIQLILMRLVKKKKPLKQCVEDSYCKMIDWYSKASICCGTRLESVEKFTWECLKLKNEILDELKRKT